MQLKQVTTDILKYMATINSSIVINPGKKIETIAPGNTSIAYYEGDDSFPEKVSIFNLNEFLGVVGAFASPNLNIESDKVTISSGKAKVTYIYADDTLLQKVPSKTPSFDALVSFDLSEEKISQITKMSGLLAANDLTFTGDGDTIIAKVFDEKNPSANSFEIDLETECAETFVANMKIDKLKLFAGDYTVAFSKKKLARFTHTQHKLTVYVGLEATSQF